MIGAKLLDRLFTERMTQRLYTAHVKEIRRANLEATKNISVIALLLGIGLYAAATKVQSVSQVAPLYLALAAGGAAMALVSRTVTADKRGWGTALLYILSFGVYLFGALLGGVYQAGTSAVMFCVFLVAIPQVTCDYGWRLILPGIFMEAVFLILASQNATPEIFSIDGLNSISCLILGVALGTSRTLARVKEFNLRDTLRGQRDTDELTSAYTRRAAEHQIARVLACGNIPCAMILIDVDNFKHINDTYGHNAGDEALAGVVACIRRVFRISDIVCRLGGDEFMIFAQNVTDQAALCRRVNTLLRTVEGERLIRGINYRMTLSVGIVFSPQDGGDFATLYRNADAAMYVAKRSGKNNYAMYSNGTATAHVRPKNDKYQG